MQNVLDRVAKVLDHGAKVAMIVMIATVTLQIVMRYVFARPLMWSEELARFGYAWFAHFGAGLAAKDQTHLRVSFFVEKTPVKLHRVFDALRYMAEIAFSTIMVWQAIRLRASMGNIMAYSLGIHLWWLTAAIIPGFATYAIYSLAHLYQLCTRKELCS
jgi:TRAP-type C4-dicarboxylate transport system permease small subunit